MTINFDLREFSIFSTLAPDELAILYEVARERHYPAGHKIIEKDDTGASLFLIVEGRVKIMLPEDNRADIELHSLERGDIFGEMSLFDGKPRSAVVLAEDDTTVVEIAREPFLQQVGANPDTTLKILGIMADRIRHSDERVREFANRVVLEAAPRFDEVVASRLEAAKVFYEETEKHASSVVSHVDRTWTALVRVGSVVMIVAAIVGAGLGALGIKTFKDGMKDIKGTFNDAMKDINEFRSQAEKSKNLAEKELKNIEEIRKSANQGRNAKTIVIEVGRIRRDFELDQNEKPDPGKLQELSMLFRRAEKQLLGLINSKADESFDQMKNKEKKEEKTEEALVGAAEVKIEAAGVYSKLMYKMGYLPKKKVLEKVIKSLLGVLDSLAPFRSSWLTRSKTRKTLVEIAKLNDDSRDIVKNTLKIYLENTTDLHKSQRDVAEILFDIQPEGVETDIKQAKDELIEAMGHEVSWIKLGAATRLVKIGYKDAWKVLLLHLQAVNVDSFISAYLMALNIGVENLRDRGICEHRAIISNKDPFELMHSSLESKIKLEEYQTTNPYRLELTRQLVKELEKEGSCGS